jgi:hypothetical protein
VAEQVDIDGEGVAVARHPLLQPCTRSAVRTDASEETDRIDEVGQDQHDTRDQNHPADNVGHRQ